MSYSLSSHFFTTSFFFSQFICHNYLTGTSALFQPVRLPTPNCNQRLTPFHCLSSSWQRNIFVVNRPWLGIPIFGSNFWDPHRKQNSDSIFDSGDSSQIFFWIPLLKNCQIRIPIPKFGILIFFTWELSTSHFVPENSRNIFSCRNYIYLLYL